MYTYFKYLYFALVCVLMFNSCSRDTEKLPEEKLALITGLEDHFSYTQIETDVLDAINDHRLRIGLPSLTRVDAITYQAYDHNEYMIQHKELSHDNFSTRNTNLVKEIGAKAVGENVAYGYHTPGAVVNAWINSEGHRENLEGDYTHFGISIAQDEDGMNYFTNIFVRR